MTLCPYPAMEMTTKSSGVVKNCEKIWIQPLEGRDVLIVEDIIDSGRTLSYLIEILKKRNPAKPENCVHCWTNRNVV